MSDQQAIYAITTPEGSSSNGITKLNQAISILHFVRRVAHADPDNLEEQGRMVYALGVVAGLLDEALEQIDP